MRNIIIIILLVFAGCDNENQIDEVNEIENYSNPSSSINMANINPEFNYQVQLKECL